MKYGNEIKNICHLAWPAIIQEAMNTVVTYVDTAMVGSMGATASAAVGLTSTVTWLLGSISVAFGVGVLAVCAQSDGAKDYKKVQVAGQQALFISFIIGLITTIISIIIAPFLPGWLNGAKEIRHDAFLYFLIVSAPFIFRTFIIILSSTLRAVKDDDQCLYEYNQYHFKFLFNLSDKKDIWYNCLWSWFICSRSSDSFSYFLYCWRNFDV